MFSKKKFNFNFNNLVQNEHRSLRIIQNKILIVLFSLIKTQLWAF